MNKYLKLTLIFAAIIGVFVALRFVDDVETDPVNPNSVSKYSKLYDEIRSKWREQKQWDEALYKTYRRLDFHSICEGELATAL